eukprot:2297766-Prymnesium_polylepis.1
MLHPTVPTGFVQRLATVTVTYPTPSTEHRAHCHTHPGLVARHFAGGLNARDETACLGIEVSQSHVDSLDDDDEEEEHGTHERANTRTT